MSDSRRILIAGLSSHWGGRLAQLLERDPAVEVLIGTDTEDPRHELQRTEFVRVGSDDSLLRRIIRAAHIDTVIDTRLPADGPAAASAEVQRAVLEGTRTVLSAAAGQDTPVRKVVFKSSAHYYGSSGEDPAFFTEEMRRVRAPRSPLEHGVALAEQALAGFAQDNPLITVTVLRCAPAIGPEVQSPYVSLLALPVVPSILGFDPRWQLVHEEDVLGALAHAAGNRLPGAYNVAADGVLALSEVAALLGKPVLPVLPPWGTVFAAVQLRRLGLRMPVELLRDLRHGRGLDNRRLKAAGYAYRYTTREAVLRLRAHQRLRPLLGPGDGSYRYEREVEEFLRWSPSVQAPEAEAGEGPARPAARRSPERVTYADLTEEELLELIPSLEPEAAQQLREHEAAGAARSAVLEALDRRLGLRGSYRR